MFQKYKKTIEKKSMVFLKIFLNFTAFQSDPETAAHPES